MIIPFVHKVGLVGQQVNVPVESLKVTDEVVVDVTGRALLEEGGPVLVIVADLPVQEEVNKIKNFQWFLTFFEVLGYVRAKWIPR